MWWKIYFWLIVALAIFTGIFLAGNLHQLSITTSFHTIIFYLEVVGLYSFLFRKRMLWPLFWIFFFWFNIALDVMYMLYAFFLHASFMLFAHLIFGEQPKVDLFLFGSVALDIPMLYTFYRL